MCKIMKETILDDNVNKILSIDNEPYNYLIYIDKSGNVCAKNGTTGKIDYRGNDAIIVIQNAVNNLTVGRRWKEKIVLKGNFATRSAILIPSYTIIELIGKVRLVDNSNTSLVRNADQINGNQSIEIIGGYWEQNGGHQTLGHGIDIQGSVSPCNEIKIRNLHIHDVRQNGININNMVKSVIEDVYTTWIVNTAVYAFIVSDCIFNNLTLYSDNTNLRFQAGSSNRFTNIYCNGTSIVDCAEMFAIGVKNNVFDNIIIDSPVKYGLQLADSGSVHTEHNTWNNIFVTRPTRDLCNAIQISGGSNRNIFTNVYIGQKGNWDDTASVFTTGIRESGTPDYNIFENVIAKDCTTPFTLVGTNSRIRNSEPKTENNTISDTFAIDSIGIITMNIHHGLAIIPTAQDCYLTVVQNTAVDDWAYNMLKIVSTDAKNVIVKINISTASATVGATAKLALKVGNP